MVFSLIILLETVLPIFRLPSDSTNFSSTFVIYFIPPSLIMSLSSRDKLSSVSWWDALRSDARKTLLLRGIGFPREGGSMRWNPKEIMLNFRSCALMRSQVVTRLRAVASPHASRTFPRWKTHHALMSPLIVKPEQFLLNLGI